MTTGTISFDNFGAQVKRIADKIGARTEDVAKNIVSSLFTRVVMKSPVDTGRFRANWNFSYDQPDVSVSSSTSHEGREAAIQNEIKTGKLGVMYLSNGLPYAGVIEYGGYPNPPKFGSKKRGEAGVAIHVIGGYSMQAPQGVVRVSIGEINSIIDEALSGS